MYNASRTYYTAHLQACRALMIISLILGLASIVVTVLGLKCTKIGRTSEKVKEQIALSGGLLFILSGVFSLIAVSWYAARVINDFYDPFHSGMKSVSCRHICRTKVHSPAGPKNLSSHINGGKSYPADTLKDTPGGKECVIIPAVYHMKTGTCINSAANRSTD
ncbi:hypothetical protein GOODEAATRI_029255 [Goodea atripinnis]|uniref:Claudin-15 n=1 Tax=Goodea atripinnis TaxID=208336 RepID=A0ABV0NHW8_9TELE